MFQIIILFGFNFGIFSWFLGVLWIYYVGLLGVLNLFLCVALRAKKCRMSHAKMTFVKRSFFFGLFELLMVLMGSSRLLLGRSSPRMDSNMSLKISSNSSQQNVNFDGKNAILDSKNVANICLK